MSYRKFLMSGVFAFGVLGISQSADASPNGVKVGVLTCHVESGWGYILGSSKNVTCVYRPNHRQDDHYVGSMSKFGVDIGYTSSGTLVWDVIAPTSDTRSGALQGDYAGATASATVAAGIGAHVLIGGFDKSIALQPVSFESNSGLDVAAGLGELSLHAVAPNAVAETSAPPAEPPVAENDVESFAVSFDFDEASLTRDGRRIVWEAANDAHRERPARILVVGHADRVGTDEYNQQLSLRRAEAVKEEMVRDGLDDSLISVSGRGFIDPAVPTPPGVRERENRQVVIVLQDNANPRQASR